MTPVCPSAATIPRAAGLDHDHGQHQRGGDERAVHHQQHDRDDREGDDGDLGRARIADLELIGDGRSLAGYIGLDPIGRGCFRDDAAHGVDGLVGQRLALIPGDIDLHVGGLTVLALRAPAVIGSPQ